MWILLSLTLSLSRMWVKSLHYTFYENCLLFDGKIVRCMLLEMIRGYFTNFYMYFFTRVAFILGSHSFSMHILCSMFSQSDNGVGDWLKRVREFVQTSMIRKVDIWVHVRFAKSFAQSPKGNWSKILLFRSHPPLKYKLQTMIWNIISYSLEFFLWLLIN